MIEGVGVDEASEEVECGWLGAILVPFIVGTPLALRLGFIGGGGGGATRALNSFSKAVLSSEEVVVELSCNLRLEIVSFNN